MYAFKWERKFVPKKKKNGKKMKRETKEWIQETQTIHSFYVCIEKPRDPISNPKLCKKLRINGKKLLSNKKFVSSCIWSSEFDFSCQSKSHPPYIGL